MCWNFQCPLDIDSQYVESCRLPTFWAAFSCGWQSYKWLLQMMASEDFDMMQLFEEENGSINSHRKEIIFAHHFSSSSAAWFPIRRFTISI